MVKFLEGASAIPSTSVLGSPGFNPQLLRSCSQVERTRIEAELRDLKLPAYELPSVKNPFLRISLLQLTGDGSFSHQMLKREADLFGLPAVLAELTDNERRDFLQGSASPRWLPHPGDVFDQRWSIEVSALMRRLGW